MGGNKNENDISPHFTLSRELCEEIEPSNKYKESFAPREDLVLIREAILNSSNLKPWVSFLVTIPCVDGGLDKDLNVYGNTYLSTLPEDAFALAREHIAQGKRITNEGDACVVTLDELLRGKVLFAYANGVILDRFLREHYSLHREIIPNPEKVIVHSEHSIPLTY